MVRTPASRITRLATPGVRKLQPYVPGKAIEEVQRELGVTDPLKLASNENPLGPAPRALAAMQSALGGVALYPDGSGYYLRSALARKLAVSPEQITLGNGSNDLLVIVAETFLSSRVEAVYSQFAFLIYQLAVQATGARARVAPAIAPGQLQPLGHDLAAMGRLINDRTRLVYIANPNNPTGTWLGTSALHEFIRSLPPQVVIVLDEAYCEYVTEPDYPRTVSWLKEFPNLVITRTFSKIYGLAGLRIGYALSSPELAQLFNRVRQPFNVNSLGLAAALASLDDDLHLERSREANQRGMTQLQQGLAALGLHAPPSAGNFLLVDLQRPAAPIYELLLRAGIIVRPVANYGLPNHLRITVGLAEQNARLLNALGHALGMGTARQA